MIRISQLKLPIRHKEEELVGAIAKALKLQPNRIMDYKIIKKSIDARKNEIKYIYTIDATVSLNAKEREETFISRCHNEQVTLSRTEQYSFVPTGEKKLSRRPVIVGTGPAGLLAAYLLAKHGYQPLVLERGYEVRKRVEAVEHFWKTNELNPQCNVQFGEGGAGTFSDGK
ncbi:MAG: dependent oxidoreductase, partial [Herbinix sp.]|nr:dependent oxidoreductase [Herbinix sp.]